MKIAWIVFAICCFSLSSVAQTFENPFKDQEKKFPSEGMTMKWKSYVMQGDPRLMKYGFNDSKNTQTIACQYDAAGLFASGLAPVRQNRYWGYINKKGERVIPMIYDEAGPFSEGLAPVVLNGKLGFINPAGQWVIKPLYSPTGQPSHPITSTAFRNGVAPVTQDGIEWYFMDKNGNKKLGPYVFAGPFRNGLALASGGKEFRLETSYALDDYGDYRFDENGNMTPQGTDTVWYDKQVVINATGTVVAENYFDTLPGGGILLYRDSAYTIFCNGVKTPVKNPFTIVNRPEGLYYDLFHFIPGKGKMPKKGKTTPQFNFFYVMPDLYPCSYEEFHYNHGQLRPSSTGLWYLCDVTTGKAADGTEGYQDVGLTGNGNWLVTSPDGLMGCLGKNGEVIIPVSFSRLQEIENTWFVAEKDGKVSLYNATGTQLLPPDYTLLTHAWADRFRFSQTKTASFEEGDAQFGLITASGQVVLPAIYTRVEYSSGGLLVVKKGDKKDIIREDGTIIMENTEQMEYAFTQGVLGVYSEEGASFFSIEGKKLKNGDTYSFNIFPSVTLTRHNISISEKEGIIGERWTVSAAGIPVMNGAAFDSIAVLADHLIAYSAKGSVLVTSQGKVAGPYGHITKTSSLWNDLWYVVNDGGTKVHHVYPGDSVFVEDVMTGELIIRVISNDCEYFRGGKTGLIDHRGEVLIPAGYDRVQIAVGYERDEYEMPGYFDYSMVEMNRVSREIKAYNVHIAMQYPAVLYRGDSIIFHYWDGRPDVRVKGDSIEETYPFYQVLDTRSKQRRVVGIHGVSEPFNHLMYIGGPDEIPFYLINTSGRCDTLHFTRTEMIEAWDETMGWEPIMKEMIIEDPRVFFTGGKFSFMNDAGRLLNTNGYDRVKLMLADYNIEFTDYHYADVCDSSEHLNPFPTVSDEHLIQVGIKDRWGLINRAGQTVLPVAYDSVAWKQNIYLAFRNDTVFRLDEQYKPVFLSLVRPIPASHIRIDINDMANSMFEPVYVVCNNCKTDTIKTTTNIETYHPDTGEPILMELNFSKPVLNGNGKYLCNQWGVRITEQDFDDIRFFCSGLVDENRYGEYSVAGEEGIGNSAVADMGPVAFKVLKDGKWGLWTMTGKWLAEPVYSDIRLYYDTNLFSDFYLLEKEDGSVVKMTKEGEVMPAE